jgi:hypothetical protein
MSRPIGLTRTLFLAAVSGLGEQANVRLRNSATEADIAELRQTVLNSASNTDREAAVLAALHTYGDIGVLCILAAKQQPLVAIPEDLCTRIVAFLRDLAQFHDLGNATEDIGALLADVERSALLRADTLTGTPVTERMRSLATILRYTQNPTDGVLLEGLAQDVEEIADDLRVEADEANDVLAKGTYDSESVDAAERGLRFAAEALAGTTCPDTEPDSLTFTVIPDSAGAYIVHKGFAYKLSAGEPYELICCEIEDGRPVCNESGAVDFPRIDDEQRPLMEQIRETLRAYAENSSNG